MERYKVLYVWKVLQGIVPQCGISVATSQESRRGRTLSIPPLTGTRMAIRTLREKSFQVEAPRLFNSLPLELRNMDCSLATFKLHLDLYLQQLPDQPAIPGSPPGAQDYTGNPSNSLKDWARKIADHSQLGLNLDYTCTPSNTQ